MFFQYLVCLLALDAQDRSWVQEGFFVELLFAKFLVESEQILSELFLILVLALTYCFIRGESRLEQIFGRLSTDRDGLKKEKGLSSPAVFAWWIGAGLGRVTSFPIFDLSL